MAQTAKPEAERASDNTKDAIQNVAERGKQAADRAEDVARQGLRVVERTVGAVAELERTVVHRSAEGTAELGRALVDLTVAQTRQSLETLQALSEAVDWDRVVRIQGEFWRVSLERAAELTRRYLEVTQTVVDRGGVDHPA